MTGLGGQGAHKISFADAVKPAFQGLAHVIDKALSFAQDVWLRTCLPLNQSYMRNASRVIRGKPNELPMPLRLWALRRTASMIC